MNEVSLCLFSYLRALRYQLFVSFLGFAPLGTENLSIWKRRTRTVSRLHRCPTVESVMQGSIISCTFCLELEHNGTSQAVMSDRITDKSYLLFIDGMFIDISDNTAIVYAQKLFGFKFLRDLIT